MTDHTELKRLLALGSLPPCVGVLIAENERLKAWGKANGDLAQTAMDKVWAANHERDQLKAENAGLKTGYEAYERVNAELKAEVEALESSRAKLVGELSRLRAKHKDWSVGAAMGKGERS